MTARDEVSGPVAVRTAGLPASAALRLSFTRTAAVLASVLDTEDRLARDGARLADELHVVIGQEPDPAHRRRLVELRRALFAGRDPKPGRWDGDLAARVPGPVATGVDGWLAARETLRTSRDHLDDELAAEHAQKAGVLLDVARTDPFGRAMAMASPDLLDEIRRWTARPHRVPKDAKLSRLAVYVLRASAKTSPFSFFALSRLARWTDDGPAVDLGGDPDPRAVLEVDAGYLDRLAHGLARHPALAGEALLRVNPSAVPAGSRIEFLGRPPEEAIRALPVTAATTEALKIVADRPGHTRSEIADLLAEAAGQEPSAAARYLDRLVGIGLVEAHLPVPDGAADWLGACAAWLDDRPVDPTAGALAPVSARLRRPVPPERVDEHRERLDDVRSALARVVDGLDGTDRPAGPPVLFENAVDPSGARLGRACWQPVLDDLAALRPWLGVFDVHLPKRIAVAALHAERFGAGSEVRLLALYRAVTEVVASARTDGPGPATAAERAVADTFGPADPARSQDAMLAGAGLGALRELHALRVRARDGLDGAPDADGVLRLAPERLREQVRCWPSWLETPSSLAFYLQPHPGGAVLNTAHGGHGRGSTRLRHLLDGIGDGIGDGDGDPPGTADVRVAELAGRHGSTLNVRAAAASAEITYPFATGSGAGHTGVPFGDLIAVHHPDRGTVDLRCAGTAERLLPAHLGLMSTEYLPPAAGFLTQVFGTDWHYHPGALTFVPFGRLGPETPVVSFPRLDVGRVTVRRAGTLAAASEVPRRASGERDAEFLLRLARWFRRHDVPPRCVVRTWLGGSDGADRARRRTRLGKPLPYDLANWFLVPALDRLVADASMVLFEEWLPGPQDAVRLGDESYVTELVVETTGRDPR